MNDIKNILENSVELDSGKYVITEPNGSIEIRFGHTILRITREQIPNSCLIHSWVSLRNSDIYTPNSSTWHDTEYSPEETEGQIIPLSKND